MRAGMTGFSPPMVGHHEGLLLSVVLCTFNREEMLPEAIESLMRQSLPADRYEVIVVDNASTDGTADIVRRLGKVHPGLRYVREDRQGLSHARNRGWQEAKAGFVAYIDDDALADRRWAEALCVAFRERCPEAHAVGGIILPWYRVPPPPWFDDSFETRTWGTDPRLLDPRTEPFGFSGSNMAFRRATLEEYGGFSVQYGMVGGNIRFGEESELFLRLSASGIKLYYDPGIVVRHAVNQHHYDYRYIALRSYRSGISHLMMDRLLKTDQNAFAVVFRIMVSILHAPLPLLTGGNPKLDLARKIRIVSHLWGYLREITGKIPARDEEQAASDRKE